MNSVNHQRGMKTQEGQESGSSDRKSRPPPQTNRSLISTSIPNMFNLDLNGNNMLDISDQLEASIIKMMAENENDNRSESQNKKIQDLQLILEQQEAQIESKIQEHIAVINQGIKSYVDNKIVELLQQHVIPEILKISTKQTGMYQEVSDFVDQRIAAVNMVHDQTKLDVDHKFKETIKLVQNNDYSAMLAQVQKVQKNEEETVKLRTQLDIFTTHLAQLNENQEKEDRILTLVRNTVRDQELSIQNTKNSLVKIDAAMNAAQNRLSNGYNDSLVEIIKLQDQIKSMNGINA